MIRRTISLAVGLCLVATSAAAGPLDDLAAGEWYEVPNSHLRDVAYDWSPDPTPGNVGGIIKAWGGGAFDTQGERLLILGGGHGDYGGNEIYALDLDTVNDDPAANPWTDLTVPEAYGALDPDCSNPDNLTDNDQRRSQHTYSRLAYIPALNALCDTGGSIGYTYCPALRQLDCYDFDDGAWHLALTAADAAGTGSVGAVHPVTGEWWLQGGSGSGLLGRFDPQTLTWTYGNYDNIPGSSPGNMSAAIDPIRNRLIVLGNNRLWALDLDTFEPGVTELSELPVASTGGDDVVAAGAPGFAYDQVQDRMVAWIGGSDVYLLNLDDWTWSRSTPGGAVPTAAAQNGTYGRFRYSSKYNVFVAVNSVDENAYVLKLAATPPECSGTATTSCYEGPVGTATVGVCEEGVATCENGRWGDCVGQVLPSSEVCDSIDNDCNGVVDDGCGTDAGVDAEDGSVQDSAPSSEGGSDSDAQGSDAQDASAPSGSTSDEGCSCSAPSGGASPRWGVLFAVALMVLRLRGRR